MKSVVPVILGQNMGGTKWMDSVLKPHRDAVCEDAFCGAVLESHQHLLGKTSFFFFFFFFIAAITVLS